MRLLTLAQNMRRLFTSGLVLIAAGTSVDSIAWTPLTDAGAGDTLGTVPRWDLSKLEDGRIPYKVNLQRLAGSAPFVPAEVTEQQLLDEVFGGLTLFTELSDSTLKFRYDGTTENDWGFDGENVITFKSEAYEAFTTFPGTPLFVQNTKAIVPGELTTTNGETVEATFAGEILDADVLFNPDFSFEVGLPGPTGSNLQDLRGAVATGVRLMVGLDGSSLASSVFRTISVPRLGYDARRLTLDDQIAFAALYPSANFLSETGRISGSVTNSSDAAVFGASVVAIDASTGIVITSTLTGLAATNDDGMPQQFSPNSGDYLLVGLPPGDYQIFVEPLDGPDLVSLNGVFSDDQFQPLIDTNFGSITRAQNVTVTAGGLISDINMQVPDRVSNAPNVAQSVFMADENNQAFFESARLVAGQSRLLAMFGDNLQDGTTLLPNTQVTVSGTGVAIDVIRARESDITLTLDIAADALPGPRLLTWSNSQGSGTLAGAVTVLPAPNPEILPFASVLPSSRSVSVGNTATAFASVINAGVADALDCRIRPQTAVPGDFFFQPTNPTTNAPIGLPNALVDIPAGSSQTFVFGFTPTAELASTPVGLGFVCGEVNEAPSFVGLNTLQLAASSTPVPDIVALGATPLNDGIAHIPGNTGTGFFSVATVNIGASADIRASVDTNGATLPANLSICQTDPMTAACINPTTPTTGEVALTIESNETPTFAVFVQGSENIALDPAGKRIFVRFRDVDGLEAGSTSVAVQTD